MLKPEKVLITALAEISFFSGFPECPSLLNLKQKFIHSFTGIWHCAHGERGPDFLHSSIADAAAFAEPHV